MEKPCRKWEPKASPRPLFILVNSLKQPLYARNSFTYKIFGKGAIKNLIFISCILSEQVWWCNIKQFLSYSKKYNCKFMQANSWHHKLFHFYLSFWSGKCGKEDEKLQEFEYLENEKSFLDEIKKHFSQGSHLVKR